MSNEARLLIVIFGATIAAFILNDKATLKKIAGYLGVFSIFLTSSLLLIIFLFSGISTTIQTLFVTFSGLTLAFWLQAKIGDYIERKKCRSLLASLLGELRGNYQVIDQLLVQYKFPFFPLPPADFLKGTIYKVTLIFETS